MDLCLELNEVCVCAWTLAFMLTTEMGHIPFSSGRRVELDDH